ncbi:carbohydrate kinase [bacterium]|nr:carbohydrate kinase [bacterium]
MKVLTALGEILWDVYPDRRYAGGAPANVAMHAVRLGLRGRLVSAVGEDTAGNELVRHAESAGLDVRTVQRNGFPTGQVRVTLDASGIPSFECSRDTAFDHLAWQDGLSDAARNTGALIVGTLAQRHADSREVIQRFLDEAGSALKVYDVNFRGWNETVEAVVRTTLNKCDVVKLNREEMDRMRQAFGRSGLNDDTFLDWLLSTYDLRLAALTLGPDGCVLADGSGHVRVAGRSVTVRDSTGCGDAFTAGMIMKILEDAPLEETGDFANRLGAFTATAPGAVPEYRLENIP